MKKLLKFAILLCITFSLLFAFSIGIAAEESGTCGESLTWVLDNNGHLTISGTGAMENYTAKARVPWYKSRAGILSVTIENGVTTIGDYAFNSCSNLTKLSIPKSITSISNYSFYGCSSLSSITIPTGVTFIGVGAFNNCTNLSSITIPDSVTFIDSSAFYKTGYFNNNSNWEDNALYINKHLIYAPVNVSGTYKIKDGTKNIASEAFYVRSNLTGVIIPDSLVSIGVMAFDGCDMLSKVYINDLNAWCNIDFFSSNANPLLNGADLYVNNKLLTKAKISDKITEIKDYAFYGCKSLTNVTIPDSVASIGQSAFGNCINLKNIDIPESVTSMGNSAFSGCGSLEEISIPDKITSIAEGVFSGCTSLEKITIPEGVKSIGEDAFSYCSNLKDITIPESVTDIAYYAFYNCESISNVYIYDLVAWCNIDFGDFTANPLWSGACFYVNNTPVTELEIPHEITKIKDYTFYGAESITALTIPDHVTSIGNRSFASCSNLISITLPDSITNIGEHAFTQTAYFNDNTNWDNGILYINNHLIASNYQITGSHIIKDGTKIIADAAFSNRTNLTSITIPNSITHIGDSAFEACTYLTDINFGTGVTYIGDSAFKDCIRFLHLKLPGNLTYLGDFAFYGCVSMVNYIILPKGLTYLGHSSFTGCGYILGVFIPDGVTSIGEKTFYKCESLTYLYIPDSVTDIGEDAFYYCQHLDYVYYTGSEEDWNKISIDSSNYDSLKWPIYTYNYVLPAPQITQASATLKGDTVTVTAELNYPGYGGVVIGKLINNGEVVSVTKSNPSDYAPLSFEKGKLGTQVKLFWWKSSDSMLPLCEAKTVSVE